MHIVHHPLLLRRMAICGIRLHFLTRFSRMDTTQSSATGPFWGTLHLLYVRALPYNFNKVIPWQAKLS